MNNKVLHSGSMDRLTTFTSLPTFSICIFLLAQFQIFHALPTTASSSSLSGTNGKLDTPVSSASLPSTSSDSAYPYSSYRPGLTINSYRPYVHDDKYTSDISSNVREVLHPNSVYSSQSISPSPSPVQDFGKALEYVEREIEARYESVTAPNKKEATSESTAEFVISTPTKSEAEGNGKQSGTDLVPEEQRRSVDLPFPPPFAPELDPQYERKQSGLGPISLLDQVGPFW